MCDGTAMKCAPDVKNRRIAKPVYRLVTDAGDMWGEDHVWHFPPSLRWGRLLRENIQCSAPQLALLECRDQCFLVEHSTTRDVDDEPIRPHCRDYVGIDQL